MKSGKAGGGVGGGLCVAIERSLTGGGVGIAGFVKEKRIDSTGGVVHDISYRESCGKECVYGGCEIRENSTAVSWGCYL